MVSRQSWAPLQSQSCRADWEASKQKKEADAWKGRSQGVAVVTAMEGTCQGISRGFHVSIFVSASSTKKLKFSYVIY